MHRIEPWRSQEIHVPQGQIFMVNHLQMIAGCNISLPKTSVPIAWLNV
jgi:hypothetical protein